MEEYVFLAFIETNTIIATFDLWMFWGGFDIFTLVVNYINKKWKACHITIGIFEVHKTISCVVEGVLCLIWIVRHNDSIHQWWRC